MSSDKTLGRARGLNSIADPADFKGIRGRRGRQQPEPADLGASHEDARGPEAPTTATHGPSSPTESNSTVDTEREPQPADSSTPAATPHRAVVPGLQRKRRELSVPLPVADAVAATGINAADVVMTAYREHSDAIFNGAGGRMVAKGRQRLRLSISDSEFDKLTRLGQARGWNRSETVTVLLTLALLDSPPSDGSAEPT